MAEKLLEIKDLHAGVEDKEILKGLNLSVNKGEVHVILGPNGSGKSTLMNIIMGHPKYQVTGGTMMFEGEDMSSLRLSNARVRACSCRSRRRRKSRASRLRI